MVEHLKYDNLTKQRDLAAEMVSSCVNIYEGVIGYADIFRYKDLHPSFVNNLKDAIIHFQKMDAAYSAIDKDDEIGDSHLDVFMQFELLSEHMTRGVVDVYVEMLQHAAVFYDTFLNCLLFEAERGTISRADKFINKIRAAMHFCKNSVLELRNDKMNLVRLAKNQPAELNDAFHIRLNRIRIAVRRDYDVMQEHLHDPFIYGIYDFAMNACEKGYSLYRVKDGDILANIARHLGCTAEHLRMENGLRVADNQAFPKGTTWLYYKKTDEDDEA